MCTSGKIQAISLLLFHSFLPVGPILREISGYFAGVIVSSFIFLSKFAPDGEINARFGWSMCYGVPAVVYAVLWYYSGMPQSIFHLVAMATYLGHFMKRILEVLFLHKYSKKMSLVPAIEVISYTKPRGGTQ